MLQADIAILEQATREPSRKKSARLSPMRLSTIR